MGGLGKEPRGEQRLEALTAFVNRHIAVRAVIAWHALQVTTQSDTQGADRRARQNSSRVKRITRREGPVEELLAAATLARCG